MNRYGVIYLAKIELDKYYTSIELSKYCIDKTFEIIGKDNITEIIEPSAGNGSFSNQIEDCIAYDIEPDGDSIIEQDFLNVELEYKKGRLIIGNPPYGNRCRLAQMFYKKSVDICDYISFILPIGQMNNTRTMFEFDLIYSEDLGEHIFSDVKVRCCLNIYKRPDKHLNKKPTFKLKDIEIKEQRKSRKQYIPDDFEYDLRICFWGSVGKIVEYNGQYSHEMAIKISDKQPFKNDILMSLQNVDWNKIYPQVTTPCLYQWQVLKFIKEETKYIE